MEIYYTNINRINEEVEDFVIAKNKIEKPLIDNEEIEKKMSIKEFIEYANLSYSFIINDKQMNPIAFNIFNPNKDIFVIVYSTTIEESKINIFKTALQNISYDISKLIHVDQLDIINGNFDLNTSNYFIIDNEFYR